MLRSLTVLGVSLVSLALSAGPAAASAWPASTTGTNIGGGLSGVEPSGIVWDNFTGALWLVGDEGQIARMLRDGTNTTVWQIGTNPDLEAIAVTGTSPKIYVGQEYPPTIFEYNSSSTAAPTPTPKNWALGLPATSSDGMEGLTWVPNGYHPYSNSSSGGVFFASSQQNGRIYVYDVNLSQGGTTPTLLGFFRPDSSQTDISDLYFSAATHILYVLYDSANKLVEVDTSTTAYTVLASYTLPTSTSGQEGVTLLPQCPASSTIIYLADDNSTAAHDVFSFTNFPQPCQLAP